jgi:hypothetical protein
MKKERDLEHQLRRALAPVKFIENSIYGTVYFKNITYYKNISFREFNKKKLATFRPLIFIGQ